MTNTEPNSKARNSLTKSNKNKSDTHTKTFETKFIYWTEKKRSWHFFQKNIESTDFFFVKSKKEMKSFKEEKKNIMKSSMSLNEFESNE